MTFNQAKKRIKAIALDHKQIRNFYEGLGTDFLTDRTNLYPSCFMQTIGGSISTSHKTMTFSARMYLLDLVHVSEGTNANVDDVQSDMLLVAMDMIAQMAFPGWTDWRISQDNNMQLQQQETENDMVAGCYFDFTVSAPFTQNICQVPSSFSDYGSITDVDMKVYYDVYTATGKEGAILTIPLIAGKKILLIIRDNNTLYPVSNLPDSTQYVFDGTNITLGLAVQKAGERFLILYRSI